MTTMAGVYIGLGLIGAAWVGRATRPDKATNLAGWIFALVIVVLLLLRALGVLVIER